MNVFDSGIVRWSICTGVLGVAVVLFFYRLGDGSLYDWDEAIYAQAAKEMLRTGAWDSITWDGHPFFHKPPLSLWFTALTYHVTGINEFGARFSAALLGFGVVVLTLVLGMRVRSWAVGAGAALLLLVVDQAYYSQWWNFLSLSRVGMMDTPLTFWIMIALLLVWEAERRPWLLAFLGIPVGLAVLTKAWPGLFAVLIAVAYWLLTRRGRKHTLGYWAIAGLLAGAVILPWHLWQYRMYGQLFLREYVEFNLVGRLFEALEEHHGGPFFYLAVVRRGFGGGGYLLPIAYLAGVWRALHQGDRGSILLLTWVAIPLVIFSIAQTKIGWYINLIYPALALLLSMALADLLGDRIALGVVALVIMGCCLRFPAPADGSPDVRSFAQEAAHILTPGESVYVIKPRCATDEPTLTAGELLISDTHIRPSMVFYLDRPLTCVEEGRVLVGDHLSGAYVITDVQSWPRFSHFARLVLQTVQDGEGYVLARMH